MSSEERRYGFACLYCCLGIGLLLTVILLPLSFSKLEYYECGLERQKTTSQVNKDTVFNSGLYLLGPDYEFKVFPASYLLFNQRVSVWTKSGGQDAGATISIDISFIYKLRIQDLGKLFTKVAHSFEPLVTSFALDAIKSTSILFGVDDYLRQRGVIEAAMMQNVTNALRDNIFCDVIDLQLRRIILSGEYEETKLNSALQNQKNEMEKYVQRATVIEEATSFEVLQVQNEALKLEQYAKAQANVIRQTAEYEAKQQVEEARSNGLKFMLSELGLNTDEHKASLDYITTLTNNKARITPYVNLGAQGFLNKLL